MAALRAAMPTSSPRATQPVMASPRLYFTARRSYDTRLDTQVNLPKMEEGGLDAAFFIVYKGQGPRTPEGYRAARDSALMKFDAIHRMTELHLADGWCPKGQRPAKRHAHARHDVRQRSGNRHLEKNGAVFGAERPRHGDQAVIRIGDAYHGIDEDGKDRCQYGHDDLGDRSEAEDHDDQRQERDQRRGVNSGEQRVEGFADAFVPAHGDSDDDAENRSLHGDDHRLPTDRRPELRLGHAGVPRTHPEWFPLNVLNMILGGKFTSRINLNLRERHGYTYGATSRFVGRLGPGPFLIEAAVATESAGAAAG